VADLFVDTGAFYALADASDEHHESAKAFFLDRLGRSPFVTSDYVFVETWCLLRARLGRGPAMKSWDAFLSGVVRILGVGSADVVRARQIAADWSDQDFSLVDCTSFALMERHRIRTAFAFDGHFRAYRFGPRRRGRFEVVP
jgi:predicted nucleic acid-binding protein